MKRLLFLLILILFSALALSGAEIMHAESVLLNQEDDAATMKAGDIGPGYEYKVSLPYDVQLQYGGDNEYYDSKLMVSSIQVEAGLGDDVVMFIVKDAGKVVFQDILGSRQSLFGVRYRGSVSVVLHETCTGVLQIYYDGKKIVEKNLGPSPVAVYIDNDARVDKAYQYSVCSNTTSSIDIPTDTSDFKVFAAAAAGVIALVAAAIVGSRG